MSVLYLYALVPAEAGCGDAGPGIAGERVRLVQAGALAAVVGALDAPPALALASLRAHDALVRRLAARAPGVLPLRFGQLAADEDALRADLERARPRLLAALERVAGCEQTTLRVHGEGGARAPDAACAPAGLGPGARHLAALRARRAPPAALAQALRPLAPLVRAERVERRASGPPASGLQASVYHLVRRADREPYARALADALAQVRGLRVRASGPWPPWAFAAGFPA